MRAYPESFDMATVYGDPPAPSSIPFIQGIKPLLDEEKEIKENIVYLQEMTVVFQDAVEGTPNPAGAAFFVQRGLACLTCDAFGSWATSFTRDLKARKEQILTELQNECNVG